MTKTPATKTFTRRDSATAVLRKLGIKATDYHLFITLSEDRQFICHVKMAQDHLINLDEQMKPKAAKTTRVAKTESNDEAQPEVEKAMTVSQCARKMILAGKTNLEVWNVLKAAPYNLDEKKRGYPAWYRFQLRKNGEKV